MIQKLKDTAEAILANFRATDAQEREALAALTTDTTLQQLRAEKFRQLDQLVAVRRRAREAVVTSRNEIVGNLASDRNTKAARLADLLAQTAAVRDDLRSQDVKIRVATAERDRVQLREVDVTVRLHSGIDRVLAPREAELLDPRVWPSLVAEAAMKGEGGAHAITFRYDERTGALVGTPTFHYTQTEAERTARQRRAAEQIQERRAALGIDAAGARMNEIASVAQSEDGR